MKTTALLALGLFAAVACGNPGHDGSTASAEAETVQEQPAIGGDKDAHGCLTSAGETWSEIKQACVQIFNIAQRLHPVADAENGEAVFSAFVLLSDDRSKAELFLPGDEGSIVLDKGEGDVYEYGTYRFDAKADAVYLNGEKQYVSEDE